MHVQTTAMPLFAIKRVSLFLILFLEFFALASASLLLFCIVTSLFLLLVMIVSCGLLLFLMIVLLLEFLNQRVYVFFLFGVPHSSLDWLVILRASLSKDFKPEDLGLVKVNLGW
jgi:hypothetical protein